MTGNPTSPSIPTLPSLPLPAALPQANPDPPARRPIYQHQRSKSCVNPRTRPKHTLPDPWHGVDARDRGEMIRNLLAVPFNGIRSGGITRPRALTNPYVRDPPVPAPTGQSNPRPQAPPNSKVDQAVGASGHSIPGLSSQLSPRPGPSRSPVSSSTRRQMKLKGKTPGPGLPNSGNGCRPQAIITRVYDTDDDSDSSSYVAPIARRLSFE